MYSREYLILARALAMNIYSSRRSSVLLAFTLVDEAEQEGEGNYNQSNRSSV